jgi:hypothetical protein
MTVRSMALLGLLLALVAVPAPPASARPAVAVAWDERAA